MPFEVLSGVGQGMVVFNEDGDHRRGRVLGKLWGIQL